MDCFGVDIQRDIFTDPVYSNPNENIPVSVKVIF
jgi:hypothetical protein